MTKTHVTNKELSKKLADAGLDVESEFYWWQDIDTGEWKISDKRMKDFGFPAHLLSELLDIAVKGSETGDFHLERNPDDGTWGASIDCFENYPYIDGETPQEAVGKLLLWLIEEGHVNPEEL